MTCHEARRHWHLYHDSEGDATLHFEISEHLAMCPACAEWFAQQSRLEGLIVEKLAQPQPTPGLWDRVLARSGVARPARARRWLLFSGIAACAATILIAGAWIFLGSGEGSGDLAKLGVAWHKRLVDGSEAVQFHSESDLEVEGYLKRRVGFPVRCPPRKDAGFAVRGAGVCWLSDQSAAYLLGNVDEMPVSIVILPRESLTHFPRQWRQVTQAKTYHGQEGPYQLVLAIIDRNAVLVIGQTDREHLERVLKAYGTYPDHSG